MNFQLFIFYPSAVLPLSAVMPLSPRPLRCSCLITLRISSRSCINLTPLRHYHCLGGGAPLFAYPAVKPEASLWRKRQWGIIMTIAAVLQWGIIMTEAAVRHHYDDSGSEVL
jgi:hypothetical protein